MDNGRATSDFEDTTVYTTPGAEMAKLCAGHGEQPAPPRPRPIFPEDDAARAEMPLFDGLMAYFPNALAYVAMISKKGSDKHNPGEKMHWARGKSTDHKNKIARHLIESGNRDSEGMRHSGNLAWRALALLQTELEEAGLCPPSPASKF